MEGKSLTWLGRMRGKTEPPESDEANEYIERGLKILETLSTKPDLSMGHLFLGELYANRGLKAKAMENLKKAEGMFEEMGMDYWLNETRAVLEKLPE